MSSTYEVGDLVQFRTMRSGVVKGKVTATYSDLDGPVVVWRVTARLSNIYPTGMEVVTDANSPWLSKRKRYSHD